MISREEKEDNKLTMICYLGTFNWNIAKLKTKSYEEVEKLYLSMNPPKGLIKQPITLDKDIEEGVIPYSILNLMKSWAINGLSKEQAKYRGVIKRSKNKDKIKAYEIIQDEIFNKLRRINNFDLKYHTYCLESATEKVELEQHIQAQQSKLNAIEEVIENTKNSDFNACHEILRYIVLKIKEILGDKQ